MTIVNRHVLLQVPSLHDFGHVITRCGDGLCGELSPGTYSDLLRPLALTLHRPRSSPLTLDRRFRVYRSSGLSYELQRKSFWFE